ncbi:MAG: serine--tRNA ligase [Mycoplasmataceae bacterium]|nr:serine--tRNA ligase [Mycoplasmataceae bacterium]
MIDISLLREKFDEIVKKISRRKKIYPGLNDFLSLDTSKRKILTEIQNLNEKRNKKTIEINTYLKKKDNNSVEQLKKEVLEFKKKIDTLTEENEELENKLNKILSSIPNIPDDSIPDGDDEESNVEIRKWGQPTNFNFDPLPHWELASKLKLADFERAVKLSGSRHTILTGNGARLMRALRDFTIDLHSKDNYIEIQPPVLINQETLYGTGHLPKSKDDMFELKNGQFLSPTEEIPLTGMYRNETFNYDTLPIKLTSSTISFRSEAGAAGKDVRGFIRQHQFYNTEMVIFDKPETSMDTLEKMTSQCEKVLKLLELPYRVIVLCAGDMGSCAVKTYDVEVWFPCNKKYREISSCSNCRDYQARGLAIKYLNTKTKKKDYVHTLNGTGTSLNRLWIAIIENYQQKDGTILIPKVLRKYFNDEEYIK